MYVSEKRPPKSEKEPIWKHILRLGGIAIGAIVGLHFLGEGIEHIKK